VLICFDSLRICDTQLTLWSVNVTVFSKVHHRTGNEGSRRGEEVSCIFFNLGARWGWVVNDTPAPLYPQESDPLTIVFQEAGWASGPVWTSAGSLASTGIRSPDRPAWLHYTGISTEQ
jgi:hypothetical protein